MALVAIRLEIKEMEFQPPEYYINSRPRYADVDRSLTKEVQDFWRPGGGADKFKWYDGSTWPEAGGERRGERGREAVERPSSRATLRAEKFELFDLQHRTGKHETPDALVYVPAGFDPEKPVRLVIYNHGLTSNVREAFNNSQLKEQLDAAPPNTVLIVPEWAENPEAYSQRAGRFHNPGFFRGMLDEIMAKTPALAGLRVDQVGDIAIMSHSGGYNAAMSQIYKNGLYDKVTSVTLLDSLYNGRGFDRWIQDNIYDLSVGRKRFQNIFSGTAEESKAQASRVETMLLAAGLPKSSMLKDYSRGNQVLDDHTLRQYGIVFKYSSARVNNRNAHNSVTNLYVGKASRA